MSALPLACFVLAWRFATDVQWKRWATYLVITGILIIGCFVAYVILAHTGGAAGLLERLAIGIGMLWLTLFASRLLMMERGSVVPS